MEVTRRIIIMAASMVAFAALLFILLSTVRRGKDLHESMRDTSAMIETHSVFEVKDYDKMHVSGVKAAELITYTLDIYDTDATVTVNGNTITKRTVKKIVQYGDTLYVDPTKSYYVVVTEDDFGAVSALSLTQE